MQPKSLPLQFKIIAVFVFAIALQSTVAPAQSEAPYPPSPKSAKASSHFRKAATAWTSPTTHPSSVT